MLRIVSGRFKGRRLRSPGSRAVRPTSEKVREALFQILCARIEGGTVLDLYAGSGALGLEALSRGAARCCFVERAPAVCALLEGNIEALGCASAARVIRGDACTIVRELNRRGERFDLVLADPPYATIRGQESECKKILQVMDRYDIFAPNALVVVEHCRHECPPCDLTQLTIIRQQRYGDTVLSFYEARHNEHSESRSQYLEQQR